MNLFLDACAIIYWVEAPDPFHASLTKTLRRLRDEAPDAGIAVSRLSILECLVKPLRDSDQELLREYRDFFSSRRLMIGELTPGVIEIAAQLRAFQGLKTPDALQAATALSLPGDTIFVTGDPRFKDMPGLRVELV